MKDKEYVYELTLDEALQKLDLLLYDRNCDIRVIKARQQLIDVIRRETNKLKQDLEILEILKNHYRFNQNINEGLLVLKKPVLNEDAEKVKQWLEDDKNG